MYDCKAHGWCKKISLDLLHFLVLVVEVIMKFAYIAFWSCTITA